ncbi:MAG: hypothetical protein LC624_11230 [Halobacteriales archaeon]|nr:hypothetical protein [Halobacteriales archaeon]
MKLRVMVLASAENPGALNLARGFRWGGHGVSVLDVEGKAGAELEPLAGGAKVRPLARAKPRDARGFYRLDAVAHHASVLPGNRWTAKPSLWLLDRIAREALPGLRAALDEATPDVVLSFWGIATLPELRALQKLAPDAALVHQFQTYPLTHQRVGAPAHASALHREVLGRLDGRMHASAQMEAFVDAAVRPARGVDKVVPEAWGSWACAKERRPRLGLSDGERHVVHVGTAPGRPGSFDDVAGQLQGIAAERVHVHAVEGFVMQGAYAHTFPRMDWHALLEGQVATFLTQFDALVLLYNAPPGLQWFAGNMPARFLSGLSAGVPIAVPRGVFGAAQEFVEQRGNGFVFDGPKDLAAKLGDDAHMARCRQAALDVMQAHRLELLLPKYEAFLEQVRDWRGGKVANLK